MKSVLFILTLLAITGCSDQMRTRLPNTASNQGDALTTDQDTFRKMYIAEVTVPVKIGQTQIVLDGTATDTDHDQELTCELDVAKGTQFNYVISKGQLT